MPSTLATTARAVSRAPRKAYRAVAHTPQWVRTTLVTLAMLGVAQLAALAYAPSVTVIPFAGVMTIGMVLLAATLPHLLGSKTPPWRTVVWATLLPLFTAYAAFSLWETRRLMEIVVCVWLTVLYLRLSGWGTYLVEWVTAPVRRRWRAWRDGRTMYAALSGGYVSEKALARYNGGAGTHPAPAPATAPGGGIALTTRPTTAPTDSGSKGGGPVHRAAPTKKRARRAQQAARRVGRKR